MIPTWLQSVLHSLIAALYEILLDDTLPILSLINTSHAPNRSEELEPFASSPTLILFPKQRNWKCALILLWSMHISNFAAQFRLANEEFMQNDTIHDPLLHGKMVLQPIVINYVEVVHGCLRAHDLIFCGQRPWRRQPYNLVDIAIATLLSQPSRGNTTPSNKPYFPHNSILKLFWSWGLVFWNNGPQSLSETIPHQHHGI